MKFLAAILLVLLLADDPPKRDTTQVNDTAKIYEQAIVVQEQMMSDVDSIKSGIALLRHKLDSLKKK